METLKQMRLRFSGGEEEDNTEDTSRRAPSQKSRSYKETRRSGSWLERQFSRKMSRDYDLKEGRIDYAAAVAAAAYAIDSLENSIRDQRRGPAPEKNVPIRTPTIFDTAKPKTPSSSFKKTPTIKNETNGVTSTKPDVAAPEKIERPSAPSFRKTPTFGEQLMDRKVSRKSETPVDNLPLKRSTSLPTTPRRPSPTKAASEGSGADVWEQEELKKIKEKYEKLNSTINEWESKKKKKAKREIEGIEATLDSKRAKALERYNSEIERIESISGGARTQAEQNRRNEEIKVKDKANKYRYTGNTPATCWCF